MPSTTTYSVAGMTCEGCARTVRTVVGSLDGVTDVDVVLEGGLVTVTSEAGIDEAALTAALADAGYDVVR